MTDAVLRDHLADVLDDGTDAAHAVIGLPTAHAARALLPVARRAEAARMLRAHYGGGGLRRRAVTSALAVLIRMGIAHRLPAWRVEPMPVPGERVFHAWAGEALGMRPRVSLVLLGPPRANRKPVVLMSDTGGSLVAVAKLGWNDVTRPLVAYEASALAEIASAMAGRVHVPTLVDARRLGDVEAMMMRPLAALVKGRAVPRTTLVETVRTVSQVAPGQPVDLAAVLGHPRMRPLEGVVAGISARTAGVPVGSAHGDLHPGNLGMAGDDRPVLWDWERWTHGVPLGFDLLHHDFQTWVGIERSDPQGAARRLIGSAAEILAPLGVAEAAASDVARDYLVRLAARYVDDAQDQAGSALGRVEEWLFPAVLAGAPTRR